MPRAALAAALLLAASPAALAQGVQDQVPGPGVGAAEPETTERPSAGPAAPSIRSSLGRFGDPGGVNSALERYGIAYSLTYIGEGLGNATGGLRRGATYQGRLETALDIDLEKLVGLPRAKLHANAFQIHGRGLSGLNLGNLLTVSNIEALASTRLYEVWAEQGFGPGDTAFRIGQLAGDTEFIVSQYGGLFVNSTFGWPAITAAALPSGGPAYPLATPGARLKFAPTEAFTAMAAVFSGDPAPRLRGDRGLLDPQLRNPSGTSFTFGPGVFGIAELAFAYNQGKDAVPGPLRLPGTVKVGGWYHSGRFDDLQFTGGTGLAVDPRSARPIRGNGGVYGIVDQLIYKLEGSEDGGVGLFARASVAPGDRNLVSFYADGGVTFKGFLPGRPDDTFGVSFGYARFSGSVALADRALSAGSVTPIPARTSEALIEVTYQAQVVPGWTVQPDFQYIIRPAGGVIDPRDAAGTRRVGDAAVFGLRSTIRY